MNRSRVVAIAWLVCSLALVACDGDKKLHLGGACGLNSDCADGLLCTFGACYKACMESVDCAAGERCVQVDGVAVCQIAACGGGCPAPLVCRDVDQTCRNRCTTSDDCLGGQTCLDSMCVETREVIAGLDGSVGGPDSARSPDVAPEPVADAALPPDAGVLLVDAPAAHLDAPWTVVDAPADVISVGACEDRVANGSAPLVDDLNDNDEHVLSNEGRMGIWYAYNDGTGTQTPAPRPPETCGTDWDFPVAGGHACTHGSGFTKYGAAIGVTLNATAGNCRSCNYDASVYRGVRFAISGEVPGGTVTLRVNTADSMNVVYGGTCADETVCGDAYCANVTVSSSPQLVEVPWTQLRQQGWGTKAAFDLRRLFNFVWQTQPGGGAAFNFCVDDVGFY